MTRSSRTTPTGARGAAITELQRQLETIVPPLFEATLEWERRNGGTDERDLDADVGPAATQAEIAGLEKHLGTSLPPSYHAFLLRYGRWSFVPGCGGADLLGVNDHRDPDVLEIRDEKSALFEEFEPVNPFDEGALPLALGDGRSFVLLEGAPGPDGERAVVEYYLTEETGRHADLVAWLRRRLEIAREMLEPRKRRGAASGKKATRAATKPAAKKKAARNPTEAAQQALLAGDAAAFVTALGAVKDLPKALAFLGTAADNARVNVKVGRTVVGASDVLLAQPLKSVERFLAAMAIGAVHERRVKVKSRQAAAERCLARLRPVLPLSPEYAELAARWARGLMERGDLEEATELLELAGQPTPDPRRPEPCPKRR
jgi:hypothetical protein